MEDEPDKESEYKKETITQKKRRELPKLFLEVLMQENGLPLLCELKESLAAFKIQNPTVGPFDSFRYTIDTYYTWATRLFPRISTVDVFNVVRRYVNNRKLRDFLESQNKEDEESSDGVL